MRIGTREKALIHIAKAQLGMDDDTYREMLKNLTGKTSSKDLTPFEFDRVMRHLRRLGFRYRKKGGFESSRKGLIEEIEALARERWGEGFERPLNSFCTCFEVEHYRWLDVRHAKAVKKALLRMRRNRIHRDGR